MDNKKITYIYKALNGMSPESSIPVIYHPKSYFIYPSEVDYSVGSYTRFFFKRLNEASVHETTEQEVQRAETTMYKTTSIKWIISGEPLSDIIKKNGEEIDKQINRFPELSVFLKNKSQFYRGR
jgi:hypothetical protein